MLLMGSSAAGTSVVEGRRRCKAIAGLATAGGSPAQPCVDALIVAGEHTGRREVRGGLTLALHATRTASPASELQAIETILAAAGGESETVTITEIADQTGMSLQTVRRRLRLRTLTPALRAAFAEGQITTSVAEAAARLPEARQQALERQLETGSRVSLAAVREAAREQTAAATAELPGAVFEEREVAWPVTVRGHLTAALRAMPPDGGQAALQRRIGDALVSLETVDAAT
jgi:putative intracellular protease/amidase